METEQKEKVRYELKEVATETANVIYDNESGENLTAEQAVTLILNKVVRLEKKLIG